MKNANLRWSVLQYGSMGTGINSHLLSLTFGRVATSSGLFQDEIEIIVNTTIPSLSADPAIALNS